MSKWLDGHMDHPKMAAWLMRANESLRTHDEGDYSSEKNSSSIFLICNVSEIRTPTSCLIISVVS